MERTLNFQANGDVAGGSIRNTPLLEEFEDNRVTLFTNETRIN